MGQIRDARIREFQRGTGIKPAVGRDAEVLKEMKRLAAQLIEVVVLEKSGIRDGDGQWGGGNPLPSIIRNLDELMTEYWDSDPIAKTTTPAAGLKTI